MAETKVKAIVFGNRDMGDNDKLVTLFSLENGIIDAKLVGVKKQNAKLKLFKEPFCFAEFSLIQKGSFFLISGAELLDDFHEISTDVDRYFSACEMIKLLEKINRKGEENPMAFIEFLRALQALAYDKIAPDLALLKFMICLLEKMGYSLQFSCCISCGQKFVKAFLNLHTGEVICGDCQRALPLLGKETAEVPKLAFSAMHLTSETDYNRMATLKLQGEGIKQAITLLKGNIERKVQL